MHLSIFDTRLKTFLLAAESMSITVAAEKLYITQPAVSTQIKKLEEELNCKLFYRRPGHLQLTPQGKMLMEELQIITAESHSIFQKLKKLNKAEQTFYVGATLTIGEYLLPAMVGKFRNQNKNQNLILTVKNTKDIISLIEAGKLDIAIVEGDFDRVKFTSQLLRKDKIILVASPQTEKQVIEPQELTKMKLIMREEGSGTRKSVETALNNYTNPIQLNPYMSIGSLTANKKLVQQDFGFSFISETAVQEELKQGTLKEIKIKGLEIIREFNFIYKYEISDFTNTFIKFCKSMT